MSKANKSKLLNKRGQTQFLLQGRKGQQLNDREIFAMNAGEVEGLLPVVVERKGKNFDLVYNFAGLISLKDFLITPMTRESFGKLLRNVVEVFEGMQKAFFNQTCLLLEFDKVMFNPATQRLQFVYIPIQGFQAEGSLRSFLLEIIQVGAFVNSEDTGYVTEYIRILNSGLNFSSFELEEYIKELSEEQGYVLQKTVKCSKCGNVVSAGTNFCSVCGAKVGNSSAGVSITYDPLKEAQKPAEEKKQPVQEKKTPVQEKIVEAPRKEMTNKAYYPPAEEEEIGTSVLGMDDLNASVEGYLVRKGTGQKVRISKPLFYVGRSAKSCDYVITDNSTISNRHIEIRSENGKFYLNDLNSTNKTYVAGREIHSEIELESDMWIKLSNEEFVFVIE